MPYQISESLIKESIESAQNGAFFRDTKKRNNTPWWIEEIYGAPEKICVAAQAKRSVKDRLVISRKSPTNKKSQLKCDAEKAQALTAFKSHVMNASDTPEKIAANMGLYAADNERLCFETGEILPRFSEEIETPVKVANEITRQTHSKSDNKTISTVVGASRDEYMGANIAQNRAHFQKRNWSEEFRIVCTSLTSSSDAPDANTGQRITDSLTSRARGKIIDSGLYMQAVKGGFDAFLTVTLDSEARYKLDNKHYKKDKGGKKGEVIPPMYSPEGELLAFELIANEPITASGKFTYIKFDFSTIGEQLSPFMDALGKRHKRGMKFSGTISNTGKGKKYAWGRVDSVGRNDRMYPWGKVSSVGGKGISDYRILHKNERLYSFGIVECIETPEVRAYTNKEQQIQAIECAQEANKKPVFDYVWVAEAPQQKLGVKAYPWGEVESIGYQNYHAHILIRWNVEPIYFHEWAAWIEKTWGKGFVTIERIKNVKAATTYLLKALGYLAKGENTKQGTIRGNRYNISKYARAEAWENLATHEAQHMYGLIREYMLGLEKKQQRKLKAQLEAKKVLATKTKLDNINKQKGKFTAARQRFIESLEDKFNSLTDKVKSLANELHGNFARGGVAKFASESELSNFLDFAIGVRGWRLNTVFNHADDEAKANQYRESEKQISFLMKAKARFDESIDGLCRFYSRFEPVPQWELFKYEG